MFSSRSVKYKKAIEECKNKHDARYPGEHDSFAVKCDQESYITKTLFASKANYYEQKCKKMLAEEKFTQCVDSANQKYK